MGPRKRKAKPTPFADIRMLVQELIQEPEKWMDSANDQLGGEKPKDLLGTPKEQVLRNLLESIRHGMFS